MALSRSTNSSPAILWIMPVAANAPVSDRVEPTTIGLPMSSVPAPARRSELHAAVAVTSAISAATSDDAWFRLS